MKRAISGAGLVVLPARVAIGQPAAAPAFEVASIKVATFSKDGSIAVRMAEDPGRIIPAENQGRAGKDRDEGHKSGRNLVIN